MAIGDSCGGLRQSTYDSSVYYAVCSSSTWYKSKFYHCPEGYYWACTEEENKYSRTIAIQDQQAYIIVSVDGMATSLQEQPGICSVFVTQLQQTLSNAPATQISINYKRVRVKILRWNCVN